MEVKTSLQGPLDYVAFNYFPDNNSYQVSLCHREKTEILALESPEQIILHLPPAEAHFQQTNEIFKLQPAQNPKVASWFTKETLNRFFHIVGASELLRHACALENEMSQLEEARRFHLVLHAEGDGKQSLSGAADRSYVEGLGLDDKANGAPTSGDATKNQLLDAMDVRLTTLKEELTSTLDQAAGGSCSFEELADLLEFTQSFGSTELKSLFLRYFSMSQRSQAVYVSNDYRSPSATMSDMEDKTKMRTIPDAPPSVSGHLNCRQTAIDIDESSYSSGESYNPTERSRLVIKSGSPRRSASSMRRVQIGRSGAGRSTTVTIKSLGFCSAREKISSINRETKSSSEDDDPKELPRKPESSVRSMSVQDAINLFESKQRNLNFDFHKRRASVDTGTSFISTKKTVLRRSSTGMEDNYTKSMQDSTSSYVSQKVTENSLPKSSVEEKAEGDPSTGSGINFSPVNVKPVTATDGDEHKPVSNGSIGLFAPEGNKHVDLELISTEWNPQQNAELGHKVLEMMEDMPSRDQNQAGDITNENILDVSSAQKGGFRGKYKQKKNANMQIENAETKAEKEAKFKALQENLDRKKTEISNKSGHANVRQNQLEQSRRTLRHSFPSGNHNYGNSKPIISRKTAIRSSAVSTTHTSSSYGASPCITATPTKTSTTSAATSTSTVRIRKKQAAQSPTRTDPRMERSQIHQSQNTNRKVQSEEKHTIKSKNDKKHHMIKKGSNSCVKSHVPSVTDDSTMISAKPSFYNMVTKKSSVVPWEAKPFLRKGTGIGPRVGPAIVKTKVVQLADSSKAVATHGLAQESVADAVNTDASPFPEINENQVKLVVADSKDYNFQNKFGDVSEHDDKNNDVIDQLCSKADDPRETEATFSAKAPLCIEQINAQEDVTDLIWAQMDQQEKQLMRESAPSEVTVSTVVTPELSVRSVSHSLSQMLQADCGEAEIANEWGIAENPPALIYQKDSPKGFKRLLKFARKNRGGNSTPAGWGSSPVLSEGENDNDEPKGFSKKKNDSLLRKSAPLVKGFGQQKTVLGESYDGGSSSKRSLEYDALREQVPTSRLFFSLSTFRSKGNETRIR
ncbi:unnamed protein product [Victoria cruziana]